MHMGTLSTQARLFQLRRQQTLKATMFEEAAGGQTMTRHRSVLTKASMRYYLLLSLQSLSSTLGLIPQLCFSLTSATSPQSQFLVAYRLIMYMSQRQPYALSHSQPTLGAYHQILTAAYRQSNFAAYRQFTHSLFQTAAYRLHCPVRPAASCPTFQGHS